MLARVNLPGLPTLNLPDLALVHGHPADPVQDRTDKTVTITISVMESGQETALRISPQVIRTRKPHDGSPTIAISLSLDPIDYRFSTPHRLKRLPKSFMDDLKKTVDHIVPLEVEWSERRSL